MTVAAVMIIGGAAVAAWWILRLLRAQEQQSAQLAKALETNEMLLRGTHHRGKHNLQSVMSLVRQAALLEQTTVALDAIANHIKRSAEQSDDARAAVMKVTGSMVHTEALMENAVAAMARIENSSLGISSIIGVIDEIAFQTNLLALNAGVEPARAVEGWSKLSVCPRTEILARRHASASLSVLSSVEDKQGSR